MSSNKNLHIPVLAEETIRYLQLKKSMVIADCTVGIGGHAEKILEKIGNSGYLIGIDIDSEALQQAESRLEHISDKFRLFHSNYINIGPILKKIGLRKIDGAVFDLGVSSPQLERAERGFSIKLNGPIDMRMDKSSGITASDLVNRCTKLELSAIFKKYGDEYFAERIADRIISERGKEHIKNTTRLAEIVKAALPHRYRFKKIHPATKVFMALRIAVNNELENLKEGLAKIISFLNRGSRLCVISFHSIEDRIVKNRFRELAKSGELKIITKKPVRPSQEEIKNNPRARSAKLRVGEKI